MSRRSHRPSKQGSIAQKPAQPHQRAASGDPSGVGGDEDDSPRPHSEAPEEPGAPVEATERGLQFLRDATEQYTFELDLPFEADDELVGATLGQIVSDATLEAAQQNDFELPLSAALSDDTSEVTGEPDTLVVDLTSDAIVGASLFDRPISDDDEQGEGAQSEDDFSGRVAPPLQQPRVTSDDPSDVDSAKQAEIQRLLDERVKKRMQVGELQRHAAAQARQHPRRRRG